MSDEILLEICYWINEDNARSGDLRYTQQPILNLFIFE